MDKRALSDAERIDWLRLARSENIGPITFRQLLRHFGSAAAALAAAPDLSLRGGRARPIRIASRAEAEREVAALAAIGARIIALGEDAYPRALAALADAPPVIALRGHGHLLAARSVAIVGARNASAAGRRIALDIAAELGRKGLVVVSGLARGIDTAAHQGSLETGTIAVVGGGVDVVYPPENQRLYDEIAARGAIIAERRLGHAPTARDFPPRNRLISGLSLGVVVVEAALRSGSLITARFAADQGREVCAVSGSPLDPRCRGTNGLIKEGATLVESAADVVAALQGQIAARLEEPDTLASSGAPLQLPDETALAAARRDVTGRLGPTPVTVDELVRQCQFSPAIVLTVLLELELAGRLDRQPGGRVAMIP